MSEISTSVYSNFSSYKQTTNETHKIEWSPNGFRDFSNNITQIILKSETEHKFQIKLKLSDLLNNTVNIYFSYPEPITVEARFTYQTNVTKEFKTIKACSWNHLSDCYRNGVIFGISTTMIFIFNIINDNNTQPCYSSALSSDFELLFNEGLFSDATMMACDGTTFKIHKSVLGSRSPVLKAHFLHNTLETKTNILESSFEKDVVSDVLSFIYCDKVHKLNEIPEKLLAAADFYQLSGLKSLCEKALHRKLTVENALDTLILADLYKADKLKQLTLRYITDDDTARMILSTEGWRTFKEVNLIKCLYEFVIGGNDD